MRLELAGYEVVEAKNGFEGLRCYHAAPADLVITDMEMPVMDGLQMLTELRRTFPLAKVVGISGGRRSLERARVYTQRTFEKPLPMGEVLYAVQQLVATPASPEVEQAAMAASHDVQIRA
jgi:CheY-like chemotaxis protein